MGKLLYFLAELDSPAYPTFRAASQVIQDFGITDQQTPGLPPHITLSSCPPEREEEARSLLVTIGEDTAFVPLSFASLGLFGLRVAFCAPAPSRELLALHERTALWEAGNSWVPHATLLITEQEEEMVRVLPVLAELVKPFTACVSAVSLYEFWPARRLAEVRLKK